MIRKVIISCIFLFACVQGIAQSSIKGGLLPKITLSKNILPKTKFIQSIESRQIILDGDKNEATGYDYVLTDFTSIVSYKIGATNSINAGYLFRLQGKEIIHRSIQQYTWLTQNHNSRFAHRISTDQTFEKNEKTAFRVRYRLVLEKALNGDRIDVHEFYIKLGGESLIMYQGKKADLECRFMPFLGYEATKNSKFELGVDYRIGKLIQEEMPAQNFWFSFIWYYSL